MATYGLPRCHHVIRSCFTIKFKGFCGTLEDKRSAVQAIHKQGPVEFSPEPLAGHQFAGGGLHPGNGSDAVRALSPFGVDVSSGIETDGRKDPNKMAAFVAAVRKEELP